MRFLSKAALMAGFLLVLAALWPYINLLFFPGTRLYVGTHRQFFLDCAHLRPGVPSRDVLAAMRGYVLASTGEVIDAPAISAVKPTPGSSAGRIGADSSLLILPTKHDQADWCICYFRRGRLVKTVVSPD